MLKRKLISAVMLSACLMVIIKQVKAGDNPANNSKTFHLFTDTVQGFSSYDSVLFYSADEQELVLPTISLNAQALQFSNAYLKLNGKMLGELQENNPNTFRIIDQVLEQKGLPVELKYLAIVESKLKTRAVSRVGAVGAWQLMPATARYLKLKVTDKVDERKHLYKSTVAAANYLAYLHNMFDDWLLVLAAYNSGPGTVLKAIKHTGSRNFWKLQYALPKETRDHVKKYISTHLYYEGGGGITTMTKWETDKYEQKLSAYYLAMEEKKPGHLLETSEILTAPVETEIFTLDNNLLNTAFIMLEKDLTKL